MKPMRLRSRWAEATHRPTNIARSENGPYRLGAGRRTFTTRTAIWCRFTPPQIDIPSVWQYQLGSINLDASDQAGDGRTAAVGCSPEPCAAFAGTHPPRTASIAGIIVAMPATATHIHAA